MSEIDPRAHRIFHREASGKTQKSAPLPWLAMKLNWATGCVLEHHAVVQGPARLGRENHVYPFAVVGGDPQDLTYKGERVSLEVGDHERISRILAR